MFIPIQPYRHKDTFEKSYKGNKFKVSAFCNSGEIMPKPSMASLPPKYSSQATWQQKLGTIRNRIDWKKGLRRENNLRLLRAPTSLASARRPRTVDGLRTKAKRQHHGQVSYSNGKIVLKPSFLIV